MQGRPGHADNIMNTLANHGAPPPVVQGCCFLQSWVTDVAIIYKILKIQLIIFRALFALQFAMPGMLQVMGVSTKYVVISMIYSWYHILARFLYI